MRPEVYKSLLAIAAGENEAAAKTLQKAMALNNSKDLALTMKRYDVGGLSQLVHGDIDEQNQRFAVKGPMGKGLELKPGKSVAFAAGTGVLVFVDLIAHMILRRVAERGGPNLISKTQAECSLPANFQLELYTSFYSEDEALGLTLINALESMYEEQEKCPFVHVGRLNTIPEQKAVRWDESFFRKKFMHFENENVSKVYICAPPIVQEFFDRARYDMNEMRTEFHPL